MKLAVMTLSVGRTVLAAIAVIVCGVASVRAQQTDGAASQDSPSLKRIRAALEVPCPIGGDGASLFAPTKPKAFRLGVVTFVPPDTAGQFIAIRVPIGDIISRAAHSISAAQRRRAEKAAHAEVMKAVADFQKAQPK
jgi:hypothetical protein